MTAGACEQGIDSVVAESEAVGFELELSIPGDTGAEEPLFPWIVGAEIGPDREEIYVLDKCAMEDVLGMPYLAKYRIQADG